jgi:hypothetical protein
VRVVSDPCHPCHRNPFEVADGGGAGAYSASGPGASGSGPRGRHLSVEAAEAVRPGGLVATYFGRSLMEETDANETAADPTGAKGLQHAYTFNQGW